MRLVNNGISFIIKLLASALMISVASAQSELSDIVNELASEFEVKNEVVNELLVEQDRIDSIMEELAENRRQILDEINLLENELVAKPMDKETFYKALIEKKVGSCQISTTDGGTTYQITSSTNESIQFIFSDDSNASKAQLAYVKSKFDGEQSLELSIEPTDSRGREFPFRAVVRLDAQGDKIIHATFVGQRVNDQFFGLGSSLNAHQITCKL